MIMKALWGLGVICALVAAEGLNRFGGFIAAIGGSDSSFYMSFLIVSVLAAIAFVVAYFRPIPALVKWVLFAALVISTGLMLMAPFFPVTSQILGGLGLSAILSLTLPVKAK